MRWLLAAVTLWILATPGLAVQPDEVLSDPALEARARAISADVRCLVCQNQSIDDSNAELAGDLRKLVRERLLAGDSDRQVLDYLVDRYGDYVLLNPPRNQSTLLLWYGPFALLGIGALAILAIALRRRRAASEPPPLTAEEQSRLEALVADDAVGDEMHGRGEWR